MADKLARREFLKNAAFLGAGLLAGGGLLEASRYVKDADQRLALTKLSDPNEPKASFRVTHHPEILAKKGLAVRWRRLDETETKDPPPEEDRLPPGHVIRDAIYLEGYSLDQGRVTPNAWLVYHDKDKHQARFVANRPGYLEPIPHSK